MPSVNMIFFMMVMQVTFPKWIIRQNPCGFQAHYLGGLYRSGI